MYIFARALYNRFLLHMGKRVRERDAYARPTHDLLQYATLFRRAGIHPYGRVSHGERRGELLVQKFYGV